MDAPIKAAGGRLSEDERLIRRFVQARFAELFLSQSRKAQSGLLAAALLVAAIWFTRTQSPVAMAWALGMVAVTGWRFFYTDRFVRAGGASLTTRRIAIVLLLNGVGMALPLISFPQLSDTERAAVTIILVALATASAATTSGYRFVFLAFTAPMFLSMAVAWALVGQADGGGLSSLGIAFMTLVFQLFLIGFGRQASQMFEEACRYRHGEHALNRALQGALELADESNRAKTHFLAAASHDLRQPIHSMTALVGVLKMRDVDPECRHIVQLLDSVNQVLSKQLDSLLDISRLDAGSFEPQWQSHSLNAIVRGQHVTMLPVAQEKGLVLETVAEGQIGVWTDETLLLRILNNLMDNAFKFTPSGGLVSLQLRREGDRAVLRITDTGIGIPADECEKVFREFYQLGNAERDRSRGLGLGLSIVKRLCELLDIELTLASSVGVGTTVTLGFSCVESPDTAASRACVVTRVPQGLTVLIVDDEAMVRQSMHLLLTQLGCNVHVADSADRAIQLATQHELDLVLSDLRLQGAGSGVEVVRAVLKIRPGCGAALITGDTAPARIREAQSAGVALLHKPVMLPELMNVLQAQAR